jgi:hypothetical protein
MTHNNSIHHTKTLKSELILTQNTHLALLGQGLNKLPIGQKLDFANHPYLRKGFYLFKLD